MIRRAGLQIPKLRQGSFRERPLAGPYKYVCLDALFVKCREDGGIVNVACRVAIAEEDGAGWLAFLRNLRARGLKGVELVISDAHPGPKDAIASVLRGAAWQRCRTHLIRNLLTKLPKAHGLVATFVRTIFAQPDAESVKVQHARTVEQLQPRCGSGEDARGRRRDPRVYRFPEGALAADLEQQPAGAPQPRDPPAHRRSGHLPEPREHRAARRSRARELNDD